MNGYYEMLRDESEELFAFSCSSNKFPAHFHRKIELFILLDGKITLTLNDKTYQLTSGNVAVIDSYDIHSYKDGDIKDAFVIIINPSKAKKFIEGKGGKKITNPVVKNKSLCDKIKLLTETFIFNSDAESVKESTADLILTLLEKDLNLQNTNTPSDTVLAQNLLSFINDNFKDEVNLDILSKKFGYVKEHISRVFHRYFNFSLPDYVNRLRLEYMDDVMNSGKKYKITDLLFQAGFKSVQTYYRAKDKRAKNTAT